LQYYWACILGSILFLSQFSDHLAPEQQMKHPSRQPRLLNLRSFTITHSPVESQDEVNELCEWIRRAIAGSAIEELKVICQNGPSDPPISETDLCFDGLLDHIVKAILDNTCS
jgi:hypothetical protein